MISRGTLPNTTGFAKMTDGFGSLRTPVLYKNRRSERAPRKTSIIILAEMVNAMSYTKSLQLAEGRVKNTDSVRNLNRKFPITDCVNKLPQDRTFKIVQHRVKTLSMAGAAKNASELNSLVHPGGRGPASRDGLQPTHSGENLAGAQKFIKL